MKKRMIAGLLVAGVIAAPVASVTPVALQNIAWAQSGFSDVPAGHWAEASVNSVTSQKIMSGTTESTFSGNQVMTRNEMAQTLSNALKNLEGKTGRDLKIKSLEPLKMTDLDGKYGDSINQAVNVYGVMQPMPGMGRSRFQGNLPLQRFELAWALNNYLKRVEETTRVTRQKIDQSDRLSDLKSDFWATASIKNLIDRYQVMSGYPDNTFRGNRPVTRYEVASLIDRLNVLVERDLEPLPTPEPTMEPTPEPTPMPTPMPTPEPKTPLHVMDLQLGGRYGAVNYLTSPFWGGTGSLDIWGPGLIGGQTFGLYANGDYVDYGTFVDPTTNTTTLGQTAWMAAGGLKWRPLGGMSAEDVSLTLGAGFRYHSLMDPVNVAYGAGGPEANIGLEIPLGPWLSLYANDSFAYNLMLPGDRKHEMTFSNTVEAGICLPAWSNFAIQLGYRGSIYNMEQRDPLAAPSYMGADHGGVAKIRLRF